MTKTPSSILEHLALINEVELEVKSEAAGRIHEPTFTVTVSVKGYDELVASAQASQKKLAKHKASNQLLKMLKDIGNRIEWSDLEILDTFDGDEWERNNGVPQTSKNEFNYIGALFDWVSRQDGFKNPNFVCREIPGPTPSPASRSFEVDCIIYDVVDDDGNFLKTTALSMKKKVAERMAAAKMLDLLKSKGIDVLARKDNQ